MELLITILVCWLLLRWLWRTPTTPIYIEPPPPQIVIHIHSANVLIQTRDDNDRRIHDQLAHPR